MTASHPQAVPTRNPNIFSFEPSVCPYSKPLFRFAPFFTDINRGKLRKFGHHRRRTVMFGINSRGHQSFAFSMTGFFRSLGFSRCLCATLVCSCRKNGGVHGADVGRWPENLLPVFYLRVPPRRTMIRDCIWCCIWTAGFNMVPILV